MKTEFFDIKWKYLTKKFAYPYENFKSIDDYPKPFDSLNNEDFFSKLKHGYPFDIEIEKTKENISLFNIKNRRELNS